MADLSRIVKGAWAFLGLDLQLWDPSTPPTACFMRAAGAWKGRRPITQHNSPGFLSGTWHRSKKNKLFPPRLVGLNWGRCRPGVCFSHCPLSCFPSPNNSAKPQINQLTLSLRRKTTHFFCTPSFLDSYHLSHCVELAGCVDFSPQTEGEDHLFFKSPLYHPLACCIAGDGSNKNVCYINKQSCLKKKKTLSVTVYTMYKFGTSPTLSKPSVKMLQCHRSHPLQANLIYEFSTKRAFQKESHITDRIS